jgi:acyl-CoA dehydrogenase
MNLHATMVAEATARLFGAHCTTEVHAGAENAEWQQGLWDRCEEAGLTAPDGVGGLDIVAVIIRMAARHAAPIPLAETILARMMLSAAGIAAPAAGPLTIAPVRADGLPTLTRQGSSGSGGWCAGWAVANGFGRS